MNTDRTSVLELFVENSFKEACSWNKEKERKGERGGREQILCMLLYEVLIKKDLILRKKEANLVFCGCSKAFAFGFQD